jgi:hypothetical protein
MKKKEREGERGTDFMLRVDVLVDRRPRCQPLRLLYLAEGLHALHFGCMGYIIIDGVSMR